MVKFSIRSRATFSAFGVPQYVGHEKNTEWKRVGIDDVRFGRHSATQTLELYALDRGPSGRPRFLVKIEQIDCGSGWGVEYSAYEWDPTESFSTGSNLHEVISRKGIALQKADRVQFRLNTFGKTIELPYCWYSVMDTSGVPDLCTIDRYDVSGDNVRFVNSTTNQPDLETVSRVIEYAQKKDLPPPRRSGARNVVRFSALASDRERHHHRPD